MSTSSQLPLRHCPHDNTQDCVMTGLGPQHGTSCNIDEEPLFEEALLAAMQTSWHSHRTGVYTNKEDLILCDAWLHIGTDPISGAEQKGGCFWQRVGLYFHEHRKFKPKNFESERNYLSLSKHWSFIHSKCNRFCDALEGVKKRKLSGHEVGELVRCFPCVLISFCEVGLC
jgi:hypothetical protein